MQTTGPEHVRAAKRVLRYIQGTKQLGLSYGGDLERPTELVGMVDSDYASDLDSRRSTTGYLFAIGGGVVSYNSKRQPSVALSSTEAEYMAACSATQEAIYLRRLLADLGFEQAGPTVLLEDNQGCIAFSENPLHHKKTKHIDVRYHYTREQVAAGAIRLAFIPTEHQVADMFTKPLDGPRLTKLRGQILG